MTNASILLAGALLLAACGQLPTSSSNTSDGSSAVTPSPSPAPSQSPIPPTPTPNGSFTDSPTSGAPVPGDSTFGNSTSGNSAPGAAPPAPVAPAPAPSPDPAPTPTSATSGASDFGQQLLALTNEARAQARTCAASGGKSAKFEATTPLKWSDQLASAARGHAQDMAAQNALSHTGEGGSSPWQRIKAAGYVYGYAGEDIGAGYASPEAVVKAWLSDYGHCANLMNPHFTDMGAGYAVSDGSKYKRYWTQDFGSPK